MSEKKYFWLKLRDDFFAQKEIKKLRRVAGGDTFTIIYLKMQLLSVQNEGKLIFENIDENLSAELELMLDEKIENINMTLMFLQKHKLIEELNCEEYLLPKVCNNIGFEGSGAERMRRLRAKKKASHCDSVVTQNVTCDTEIDKDLRLDTYNRSVNNDLKNNGGGGGFESSYSNGEEVGELERDRKAATAGENKKRETPEQFFEENIAPVTPFIGQSIDYYIKEDRLEEELILQAMKDSVAQGGLTWKYIQRKLEACLTQNIKTLESYKTFEEVREHNMKRNKKSNNSDNSDKRDPNYANFDQREYTEDDLKQYYITAANKYKK